MLEVKMKHDSQVLASINLNGNKTVGSAYVDFSKLDTDFPSNMPKGK